MCHQEQRPLYKQSCDRNVGPQLPPLGKSNGKFNTWDMNILMVATIARNQMKSIPKNDKVIDKKSFFNLKVLLLLFYVTIYSFFAYLILSQHLGTSAYMPRPDKLHDPAYRMVSKPFPFIE